MMEIGRLAIVAASIEDLLHSLYWQLSGVTDPVGAVITGDARAARISKDIIRIAKAAGTDDAIVEDLRDIFWKLHQTDETTTSSFIGYGAGTHQLARTGLTLPAAATAITVDMSSPRILREWRTTWFGLNIASPLI